MQVDLASVAALVGAVGSGGFLGAVWQRRNQEALFRLQVEEDRRVRAEERAEQDRVRAVEYEDRRAARFADARRDAYVRQLAGVRDLDAALTALTFARTRYIRLEERAITHPAGTGGTDTGAGTGTGTATGADRQRRLRDHTAAARAELDERRAAVTDLAQALVAGHTVIELVAPPAVRAAAARLLSTVEELAAVAAEDGHHDHVPTLRAAQAEFAAAARADLAAPEPRRSGYDTQAD